MVVAALVVSIGVMIAVTVLTASPPRADVPDLDTYLDRWSAVHEGYDVRSTRVLRGWLRLMHAAARPLATAGVLPDVLTAWTVWLALGAVALAATGGIWGVLGALLLIASGFGDALDGAVAVLSDRATAWGYVLDSVVDRLNDALYLVAAWAAGAPAWLAIGTGVSLGLLEYLRARAGNAGADHIDVITVGERPQRVICCAIAVGMAGLVPPRASWFAGVSVAILLALTLAGLVQLTVAVRSRLR